MAKRTRASQNPPVPHSRAHRRRFGSDLRAAARSPQRPSSGLRGLLADIVASSDDAIYSRHLDGTVTSWNQAAARIFGYTAAEMIGQAGEVLLPPDRPDESRQLMREIRHGRRVEHFETRRRHKNGSLLTVSLSLSPIFDRKGRVIGASTIARDMTEQRRLEAEMLEVGERERQRIGRDLHDGLGQQLAGLELLCRTLADRLRKEGHSQARVAHRLIALCHRATEQVRGLARGLVPVIQRPDGLMLALDELAGQTRTLFRADCRFVCPEPVFIADHARAVHLYRIAQEAITNALRHGRARAVQLSLQQPGATLTLRVRDRGRGLPADSENAPGLGLRIMRYRSAVMGGSLRIACCRPRGTEVVCEVPNPAR